jgi:hypothetical protein
MRTEQRESVHRSVAADLAEDGLHGSPRRCAASAAGEPLSEPGAVLSNWFFCLRCGGRKRAGVVGRAAKARSLRISGSRDVGGSNHETDRDFRAASRHVHRLDGERNLGFELWRLQFVAACWRVHRSRVNRGSG